MPDLSKEIPFGELAIIGTKGTENMCKKIASYIGEWRKEEPHYIVESVFSRLRSGDGEVVLGESVRGKDVFVVADCFNHKKGSHEPRRPLSGC